MINDAEDKLLFRMSHIVPRGLASSKTFNTNEEAAPVPEEIEIQMTWGKIAGRYFLNVLLFYKLYLCYNTRLSLKQKPGDHQAVGQSSAFTAGWTMLDLSIH